MQIIFFPGLKFLKEYKGYMKTAKRKKWSANHMPVTENRMWGYLGTDNP